MLKLGFVFLILILIPSLPVALSKYGVIEPLLQGLDSKRAPPSVQEAAAFGLLKRLLPTHLSCFELKIVSKVFALFLLPFHLALFFFFFFLFLVWQLVRVCICSHFFWLKVKTRPLQFPGCLWRRQLFSDKQPQEVKPKWGWDYVRERKFMLKIMID